MNLQKLKQMAVAHQHVHLHPHPVRILEAPGAAAKVEILDIPFELAWVAGKPALVSPGQITIAGLSASEIHQFIEPDWLVMRKQLEFRVRYVGLATIDLPSSWSSSLGGGRSVRVQTANPFEVTHRWLVVPPVVCPACGSKLH